MKLLLTSNGLVNPTIVKELNKWVKKPHFAFIPTAANLTGNDKSWLIQNFVECQKLGYVDIVDISAIDKSNWLPRLQNANVIVVGGGDTKYLMKCLNSSGLISELPELLKTRVYVGISAGSIAVAKNIRAASEFLYDDESSEIPKGLGYVNFNVRSHFNSKKFPKLKDKYLKEVANNIEGDLYALDNESAVVFVDGKIKVASEGEWKVYSKKQL